MKEKPDPFAALAACFKDIIEAAEQLLSEKELLLSENKQLRERVMLLEEQAGKNSEDTRSKNQR